MTTNRWEPFTKEELEEIQWGLRHEEYDGEKWYEPNQAMIDEIHDELNRKTQTRDSPSPTERVGSLDVHFKKAE
jgi:hypothetical protein